MSGEDKKNQKIIVLPCNGLDRLAGKITGEIAIELAEKLDNVNIICPVLLNSGSEEYEVLLKDSLIIVINGCMTRCASKLINERNLQIYKQIFLPEMAKKYRIKIGKDLKITNNEKELSEKIVQYIVDSLKSDINTSIETEPKAVDKINQTGTIVEDASKENFDMPKVTDGFYNIKQDKLSFSVPKSGYYFNENDCWVKKEENGMVYFGISDFVQKTIGDVLYVESAEVGKKIDPFEEAGSLESVKTIADLISPISCEVVEVNKNLLSNPELINKDPYQKGWVLKVKPKDFDDEIELLFDSSNYFKYLKKKIED